MNARQRMLAVLGGRAAGVVPAAPHWWGNYKFEVAGKDYMLDRWGDGESMLPVYRRFYQRFRPDWFHLSGGYPRLRGGYPSRDFHAVREGERLFLVAPDGSRDEILADESLASHKLAEPWDAHMSAQQSIDWQLAHRHVTTAAEIVAGGYTDHAAAIVREYGDEVFVCVNVGAPGVHTVGDYEGSMMALHDYPQGARRLIQAHYEDALEWAKAFASVGVHAWLISEDIAGADTISPRMYEQMLYPSDCWFFAEVAKLGMVPMVYFCGDVRPLLPLIRDSGAKGLLIEDNRKTFSFEVVDVVRQLAGKVALFGNVDTTDLMLHGTPQAVRAAVRQQKEAAAEGPFVVANGSPLVPGTPPENVAALIEEAHR